MSFCIYFALKLQQALPKYKLHSYRMKNAQIENKYQYHSIKISQLIKKRLNKFQKSSLVSFFET